MSKKHQMTRREFLRTTRNTAVGAGMGLAFPSLFLNQTKAATGENPSDLIRIGVIGTGGQGNGNINAIMKHCVAVCDVDQKHLASTKARVEKANGTKVAAFGDYRKLLEHPGIDAVLIATPDHWHTLPAAHAMMAGKDVYCEKPLTLTIEEGKALVAIARQNKRVFQTGSQQRSDAKFLKGCEYVRNGRIGKIKRILVGLPGVNYLDRAKPPVVPDSAPPPELDYNFWLGPAPWRPYNKNHVHYLFRFFWDYSGGQMTNWGAHHLDIAQWGLGMDDSGPVEIEGTGEFNQEKLYETPTKFHVTYKYANGTIMECDSGHGMYKIGTRFEGEKGTIYVNRGVLKFDPEEIEEEPLKATDIRLYPDFEKYRHIHGSAHHANWLDCIKTRKLPICDVAVGYRSASVCHLGNVAVTTGKKIKWDPVKQAVAGEKVTGKQLAYDYRAPWKLPTA